MNILRIPVRTGETVVDIEVMAALRRKVGTAAFDEFFEDALCDVTERLSGIDRAMRTQDLKTAADMARALAAVTNRLGLRSISTLASALQTQCERGNMIAAAAIAGRLSHMGERCVMAAAETSVDLGAIAT